MHFAKSPTKGKATSLKSTPHTPTQVTQTPTLKLGKYTNKQILKVSQHCLKEHIEHEIQNLKELDLPAIISIILQTTQTPLQPSNWLFERTHEAATHNTNILKSFNYNTDLATQNTQNTILSYGSEFRHWSTLEPLLKHHQHWPTIKTIITEGASYPLSPISEEDRLSDIQYMIERGNHKSAEIDTNKTALNKVFSKEVDHHWSIPLLPSCIPLIPGASVTPLGVATQWSIDDNNNRIVKNRPTHDCTFPGPSGLSCNLRVIKDQLDECMYGHALTRFITGIHAMRLRHPNIRIYMNKTDMDAAY